MDFDKKELKKKDDNEQEPVYRYIKTIILFFVLGILCLFFGMIRFGIIMILFAAGYAFFSYIQRYKTIISEEEFIYKAAKNHLKHSKEKKQKEKEAKDIRKSEYEQRLKEIEEEFDFSYDIGKKQELICSSCKTKTKIVPKKGKKPECPICGGLMIPIEAEDTDNEYEDAESEEGYDI